MTAIEPSPSGQAPIHCAICTNIDNTIMVPATTVISGYAVCAVHVEAVSGEFSDFAQLLRRIKGEAV